MVKTSSWPLLEFPLGLMNLLFYSNWTQCWVELRTHNYLVRDWNPLLTNLVASLTDPPITIKLIPFLVYSHPYLHGAHQEAQRHEGKEIFAPHVQQDSHSPTIMVRLWPKENFHFMWGL